MQSRVWLWRRSVVRQQPRRCKVADVALREAQERLNLAIADRDYLRQLIEVEQLKERHERYIAAEELLKQAEEYLETAVVDDEVVKRIEDAYIETEKAMSAAEVLQRR